MSCAINSQTYHPHPLLQGSVHSYLFTSIDSSVPYTTDIFPVGHSVLSFALDAIPEVFEWGHAISSRFNFTGQLTQSYKIPMQGRFSYVYVLFKPLGPFRLFGVPQHYLADNCIDVLDIEDCDAREVYEQLVDQGTDHKAIVRLLDQWLLKRLGSTRRHYRFEHVMEACSMMQRLQGTARISGLYKSVGMSKSSLERQFNEKLGVSAKTYSSILRFLQVTKTMREGRFNSWADLAYQHHYFDQTHFIKEFRRFSGYTPSQFLKSQLSLAGHFEALKEEA